MNEQSPSRDPRALNAYRHGLTGQVLVIPPAEQAAYHDHCRGIAQSLSPVGSLETSLVQSIADDRWRLQRAAAIEANIFALGINSLAVPETGHQEADAALAMAQTWLARGKEIERLTLYEGRLQRKVEKNLALLRQLQQERRASAQAAPAANPSPDFVFSNAPADPPAGADYRISTALLVAESCCPSVSRTTSLTK